MKIILVFGEDENDRRSLVEVVRGLRPDLSDVRIETRRNPVVHYKDGDLPKTKRKVAEQISALVRAEQQHRTVVAVVAHQDCDALEPAHENLAANLERDLSALGVPNPIAATPAWEIETWWMLFPDALAAVRKCWRSFGATARNVGMIQDAKEHLRRALRPASGRSCPDYAESDSISIASKARELGLLSQATTATSNSYADFRQKILMLTV